MATLIKIQNQTMIIKSNQLVKILSTQKLNEMALE